jgi:hypothetical protein
MRAWNSYTARNHGWASAVADCYMRPSVCFSVCKAQCRPTTELSAGWLAEADHGHFIEDGQLIAYQVPPATRALQRFVGRRMREHDLLQESQPEYKSQTVVNRAHGFRWKCAHPLSKQVAIKGIELRDIDHRRLG